MPSRVIMPQMGESVVEGTVSRWLKQEGDEIEEFEPIVEVETDKVTSEIPAPASGVLLRIYVAEGRTVSAGTLLAMIGQPDEALPEQVSPEPESVPAPRQTESAARTVSPGDTNGGHPHITPVVARIAAEHHIDVSKVRGTGRQGRVTRKDIMAYIESVAEVTAEEAELPAWEQPGSGDLFKPTDDVYGDPSTAAEQGAAASSDQDDELLPLSTMRRRIAEHMVMSKLRTAPHVTTVFEIDMSAVVAHRAANKAALERQGIRLTYTAYFLAAAAQALREYPMVNSQWTDDGILLKAEVNIGMAVALDEGLIVPVIRQADELSLAGIARRANDLAEKARRGALAPDDVAGGTFTITNHGVSGSLFATPIINQPQTGILGVGAVQKRVVVLADDAIAVRPMVYLTFTFDHRVLDGALADRFVASIKARLEGWPV